MAARFCCPECGETNRRDDPLLGYCRRCNAFTGKCAAGREVRCSGILCPPVSRSRGAIDHWMAWHLECEGLGSEPREVETANGQRVTRRFCYSHAAKLGEVPARTLQLAVTEAGPGRGGPLAAGRRA